MQSWSQEDLFEAVTPRPEPKDGGSRHDGAFSAPQRSGKAFARGKLFVFEREQILVMRQYPDVRAWKKSKGHPEWRGVSPSLVSVAWPRGSRTRGDEAGTRGNGPPGHSAETVGEGARLDRGEKAVAGFLASVPVTVRETVERFPNKHRIGMLALIGRCPEAFDVVQGNGCLAFMLMMNRVFRRPVIHDPWGAVRRWVGRRQRDALGWLGGWPGTESAARVTRRVYPESLSVPFCFRLRNLVAAQSNPILLHLPRVTSDVVSLLATPDIRDRICPSMLDEVANAKPDKTGRPRIFWLVQDALRLAAAAAWRLPRRFRSVREVEEIHGNLLERFFDERPNWEPSEIVNIEFPDAPIPVPRFTQPRELWVEPIRNGRELLEESKSQRNCVFSYATDIAERRVAVYSVREPERATVSLVPGDHGGWVIDQFLAARNKPVRRDTLLMVAAYLTRQQNKLFDSQNGSGQP